MTTRTGSAGTGWPPEAVVTRRLRTPVGEMIAGATAGGLCLLEFVHRKTLADQLARLERHVGAPAEGSHPLLTELEAQLEEYFQGSRRGFDLPLVLAGTEFQERVWRALLRIPYGGTISYAELARRVGSRGGSRAVGGANGANRIAIVVPCHRVVQANGDLGGYGGGSSRKRRLLDLEAGGIQPTLF